jgi:hypothetical protein
MRRFILTLLAATLFGVLAGSAHAAGGSYAFAGGTAKEQATVRSGLNASSFDWSVIPRSVTVHIGAFDGSYSDAGNVYLDGALLDSGRFSWGVVQHEFAHQVDFFLFDDAKRAQMAAALGGGDWCYTVESLRHSDHGCERFASELAWAYWQSSDNAMSPERTDGESGFMPLAQFRALVAQLLGVPTMAAPPTTRAFAPAVTKPKLKKHK